MKSLKYFLIALLTTLPLLAIGQQSMFDQGSDERNNKWRVSASQTVITFLIFDEQDLEFRLEQLFLMAPINIQELENETSWFFNTSPNPTERFVTIELNEQNHESKVIVKIYSLFGKLLKHQEGIGVQHLSFNLDNKPPGTYIVKVVQGNNKGIQKIIKRR